MSEKGAVDKLKDKLYSRTPAPGADADTRTPLSASPREHIGRAWDGMKRAGLEAAAPVLEKISEPPMNAMAGYPPKHRTFAARFLWGSLAFFVLAFAAAAFTFFVGGNTVSSARINLQIVAPSLIDSGKATELQFIITNNNGTPLENADLIVDYPTGTRSSSDATKELSHERKSIGTIPAGAESKQTASAAFYGSEGSQQSLSATLEYQLPNSNSIFTKQVTLLLTIGSAPLSIHIAAPEEAIAGQAFSMDLTVQSNATEPIPDAALQMQAPFGFTLASSNPAAQAGGTLWRLGTLKPGDSQIVHITGMLDGQDGDSRVFHFLVGSQSDATDTKIQVPILNVPQTLTVRKPFVSGLIALDGKTASVVPEPLGKSVQGVITWTNNLQETVSNATLTLSLKGQALDPNSVRASNGFYNSSNSTIVWGPEQDPELAMLSPGQTGTLQFSFSTISPTQGSVLTNPDVVLNLTVHAMRTGTGNVPEDISSAASARVTLASALTLSAAAFHFSGVFNDIGPMPPVANKDTAYTVVWTVKNSSNSVAGAMVSAVLPPNVQFTAAAPGSPVTFDAGSRTVTWTIGDLPPGVGYSSTPRTASFQVVLTPSVSQVGSAAPLTGAAQLTGQDRFAGATVQANTPALNTRLTTDSGFTSGMDIVQSQ